MNDHLFLKIFLYIVLFIITLFGAIKLFQKVTGRENSGIFGLFFIAAFLLSYFGTPYLVKHVFFKNEFLAKEKYSSMVRIIEEIIKDDAVPVTDTAGLKGALVLLSDETGHYSLDAGHTSKLPVKLIPVKDVLPQYVIVYEISTIKVGQWHGARNDAVNRYSYSFVLHDLKKGNQSVYSETSPESSGSGFPEEVYCKVLSQIADTVLCGNIIITKN